VIWVHWDSFFAVILGTDERLANARVFELFEGFRASIETSVGWLFEPFIPWSNDSLRESPCPEMQP
jgi:hypothetical protein